MKQPATPPTHQKTAFASVLTTCQLGVLAALAVASLLLFKPFFIFSAISDIRYDFADVFIFFAVWMLGWREGLVLTVAVSVIQGFTVSADSPLVGILMHIAATGSMVVVMGLLNGRNKRLPRMLLSIAAGVLTMTAVMTGLNLIVIPLLYEAVTVQYILHNLIVYILSFNLIKAAGNGILSLLLWLALRPALARLPGSTHR